MTFLLLGGANIVLSKELIKKEKLYPERQYGPAQRAGLHSLTVSKIINDIDLVNKGDPRVIKIGKVLGYFPEECF